MRSFRFGTLFEIFPAEAKLLTTYRSLYFRNTEFCYYYEEKSLMKNSYPASAVGWSVMLDIKIKE